MRRLLLLGLVFAAACLSTASPHITNNITISTTALNTGVFVGDTFRVIATPYDVNGDVVPFDTIVYSSTNPSVASVTSAGLVTALTAGSTTIFGSADGHSAQQPITVDGNVTGSILVTPPNPNLAVGTQQQLTANVVTTQNNPARNKTVTWSTTDATKATVSASGNVSAVAVTASVSICATANDAPAVKGCTTVTVH